MANPVSTPVLLTEEARELPLRLAESVLACNGNGYGMTIADFDTWFADYGGRAYTNVERVALDRLDGWRTDPVTGNLGHQTGRFFTVEGVDVHVPGGPVEHWNQPIINQPEIGILGILVKEFGGVLHCLMQAKVEPGNCNGLQLSPTVQATRSNYMRVHNGKSVPYLEYFRDCARHRVLADVRQSEQGAWFLQKRNRNMVVEVTEDVELLDGFCWLTLGQVHLLLGVDDLVNMDARTVLSCLPFSGPGLLDTFAMGEDGFTAALIRSYDTGSGALHSISDVLSWITDARSTHDVFSRRIPLGHVTDWRRTGGAISHARGSYFTVIGVRVTAGGREVGSWSQPMLEPCGDGVVAFLAKRIDGVLHVLVHARVEPGYVDVVELAPTVQCAPESYRGFAAPRYLDDVLTARPDQIRFDTTLSEEGGRFYHARTRYVVVETDHDVAVEDAEYRWMTLRQLVELLRHSHYVNVQARSLVACLHSLSG